MKDTTCSIDGCATPGKIIRGLCPKHYKRLIRTGSTELLLERRRSAARYRQVQLPGHPLAGRTGLVYKHRVVLHEAIGAGRHRCHWCERPVAWLPALFAYDIAALVVDHVDEDKQNNDLSNLVPSCLQCNSARARQSRAERERAA